MKDYWQCLNWRDKKGYHQAADFLRKVRERLKASQVKNERRNMLCLSVVFILSLLILKLILFCKVTQVAANQ